MDPGLGRAGESGFAPRLGASYVPRPPPAFPSTMILIFR